MVDRVTILTHTRCAMAAVVWWSLLTLTLRANASVNALRPAIRSLRPRRIRAGGERRPRRVPMSYAAAGGSSSAADAAAGGSSSAADAAAGGSSAADADDGVPRPDPLYSDAAVVALCMNALGRNDAPRADAGLETCWNFSSGMCRAAVGGSLAAFRAYARNPTFASLVNHASWDGAPGNRIAGSQTRGEMATTMVTVITADGATRKFLWTLQQERRPPLAGCWLVYECLAVDRAFTQTL